MAYIVGYTNATVCKSAKTFEQEEDTLLHISHNDFDEDLLKENGDIFVRLMFLVICKTSVKENELFLYNRKMKRTQHKGLGTLFDT